MPVAGPRCFDEALALEASAIMLAETVLIPGACPILLFASQVAQCAVLRLEALTGQTTLWDRQQTIFPDAVLQAQGAHGAQPALAEMQVNLAQVEQTLDDFFRRPERRGALPALQTPLKQISG